MIDAHVHLFPDRLMDAIYGAFEGYGWHLIDRLPLEAMLAHLAANDIQQAWALPYAHKGGMARALNAWMAEFAARHPAVIPFACIHPDDADVGAIAEEALDGLGLRGFKLHCSVGQFRCDDPRLNPLYATCVAHEAPLVIHAGSAPYHDHWTGIASIRAMLEAHPRLRVVIPHFGADDQDALFELMGRFPGLHTDTSSALASPRLNPRFGDEGWWVALREAVIAHGDRVLFGTDYPWIEEPIADAIAGVHRLALPPEIERQVLEGNARRLVAR